MNDNEDIAYDLSNHFTDKLHLLIRDTADTGTHGGLSSHEVITLLMSGLMHQLITGACALHMTEEKYMEMNKYMYRYLINDIRKHVKNAEAAFYAKRQK